VSPSEQPPTADPPDHGVSAAARSGRQVRPATPQDVPTIRTLIRELAEFERSLEKATATEDDLRSALFDSPAPAVFCHLALDDDGQPVGFALWFRNFSTWTGRHGIYLEDLYVRPSARSHGYGRALLQTLAGICVSEGYPRLEWWVLDWNETALRFYRSIGAEPMDEWTVHRVSGPELSALALGRANAM
jgi:GNAT superfamily N-acetyltransferase